MSSISCTLVTERCAGSVSVVRSIVAMKILPFTSDTYRRPSGPMARLVGPVKFVMPKPVPDDAPETISALVEKLIGAGPPEPAVTETLSNVDVLSCVVSWLVTARPASTLAAIVTLVEPTWIHDVPSLDIDAMMEPPLRDSFNHTGAACVADATNAIDDPVDGRARNSTD